MKKWLKRLTLIGALSTCVYGFTHTVEPANYVLWALIFVYCALMD